MEENYKAADMSLLLFTPQGEINLQFFLNLLPFLSPLLFCFHYISLDCWS